MKYLFGGGSKASDEKGLYRSHAYAVLEAWKEGDWTVGQQWACANVPWTVGYLDIKFRFTISEQGPAVSVLCQLDDRFLHGLVGRCYFTMHFTVYKQGQEEKWVVRSMHNSGSIRCKFRVRVSRHQGNMTTQEVIQKFGIDRKEKLLHIGRRLDYALSKGNRKAIEEANRKRKVQLGREKSLSDLKESRRLRLLEKYKILNRKQRVADAMKTKRTKFREKRWEQRHRAKERRKARDNAAARLTVQQGIDKAMKEGAHTRTITVADQSRDGLQTSQWQTFLLVSQSKVHRRALTRRRSAQSL